MTHLKLVQPGDALWKCCDAVMAGQRQMSHVSQLLHGFREVQQPPLGLLRLPLALRRLITIQHNLLQLL